MANMNVNAFLAAVKLAGEQEHLAEFMPEPSPIRSMSEQERFWTWIDAPTSPGLRAMVHHLKTFWQARQRPNIVLLHFDDLRADLEGQMRRLAARLGVSVREELWLDLVQAATFEEMRKQADIVVPNATDALWHDNSRFFNQGTSGQWRRLFDDEDLRRYHARIMEIAEPELSAWIHHGPIIT
jgi:hypothetical protein